MSRLDLRIYIDTYVYNSSFCVLPSGCPLKLYLSSSLLRESLGTDVASGVWLATFPGSLLSGNKARVWLPSFEWEQG